MFKYYIFILFIIVFKHQAQVNPNFLWVSNTTGPFTESVVASVADSVGNVYIAGGYADVIDLDPSAAVYTLSSLGGGYDFFIAKYGPWGNFLWGFSVGGMGGDFVTGMTMDSSGYLYVTGNFAGTCDFNPGPAPTGSINSTGINDMFIAKYTSGGNYLWAKNIGGVNGEISNAISLDTQANIYITGYINGVCEFDPSPATFTLSSTGDDIFVAKYDSSGAFTWAIGLNGTGSERGFSLAAESTGNVYVTGYTSGSTIDFDPGPSTYTVTSPGISDIVMAKYSSSGNLLWGTIIGGSGYDKSNAIAIDNAGNIVITGVFNTVVDFDPGPLTAILTGSTDAFIAKYNSSGSFIWAGNLGNGGSGLETGNSLAFDNSNNLYVTGNFSGVSDFDPGPAVVSFTSNGNNDVFFAKYNPLGNYLWCKSFGGSGNDAGNSIILDDSLNIYVSGSFSTVCDFDASAAIYTVASGGYANAYVTKYTECNIPVIQTVSAFPTANICNGNFTTTLSLTSASLNAATSWHWYTGSCGINPVGTGTQIVVSPTVTTVYYVRGEGGCAGLNVSCKSFTVFVGNPPTVSITASSDTVCSGSQLTLTASGATSYSWSTGATSSSIAPSPTSSTTYSVIGTNTAGCLNTAIQTITVIALPTISVTASPSIICAGQSSSLSVTGAQSYTWNPGALNGSSVIVSPALTKTYSVSGIDANGCSNNAITTVTVIPGPTLNITSSPSVCPGATLLLTAGGANTYTWSNAAITNTIVITQTVPTTYTVTGTNSVTGCQSSTTKTIQLFPDPTPTISGSSTVCAGASVSWNVLGGFNNFSWSNGAYGNPVNITPSVNTVYTVNVVTVYGCTNIAVKSLSLVSPATISVSASSNPICIYQSSTLNASGLSNYTWTPGNILSNSISVSPTVTSIYTVNAMDGNGCYCPTPVTVSVNPLPSLIVSPAAGTVCTGDSLVLTASGAQTYTWSTGSFSSTAVVTPTGNSVYSVTCTDLNGCVATAIKSVNIIALPVVTITANSPSVCPNSSIMLIANGAVTYTWSNNSVSNPIIIYPSASTNYSVNGTDASGCINSFSINVQVGNGPSLLASAPSSTLCQGDSVSFFVSGANTYTWEPGSLSGSSITIYPTSSSIYTVYGTGMQECNGTATLSINVSPCTFLRKNSVDKVAYIYPNPSSGSFILDFGALQVPNKVEIRNSVAQLVYESSILKQLQILDLKYLPKGVYQLRLYWEGNNNNVKIIID